MPFKNLPIERKLRIVILLTCGIVLLLTCVAFIAYEVNTYKATAIEGLTTLAEVIGENTTAALAFRDEDDAAKVLQSVQAEPNIVAAAVYDLNGNLFVRFPTNATTDLIPRAIELPQKREARFENNQLIVLHSVHENEKPFGTIMLRSDLSDMYRRIRRYGEIAALVMIGSFLIAFLISSRLQRSISEPILSLSKAARSVSEKKDFSVRAQKQSEDELGLLTDAFNQMLDEIGRNQTQLQRALEETKNSEEKVREMNLSLERRVKERTTELQEAVAQMEAFSYSVSHDLRSPLRAMQGYAQVLLEDYSDKLDDEARTYLKRIASSAVRMDALVQDILTYSRVARAELKIEPINLDKLVHDIIHQNPAFQSPQSRITVKSPLHKVSAHEAALTQCLTNLISNAVKFVSPGVIPAVTISTEPVGSDVRIWVQDNGIGINPQHFDRIFRMFERVHGAKTYEGTGIGLAIVKKAVERMNGRIGVESKPGEGSRFWIILPRG